MVFVQLLYKVLLFRAFVIDFGWFFNRTGPKRFEDKKNDHESTKIRRHESLNVVLFRAFNLSCFRDCVSEFSARKNAKIITKVL